MKININLSDIKMILANWMGIPAKDVAPDMVGNASLYREEWKEQAEQFVSVSEKADAKFNMASRGVDWALRVLEAVNNFPDRQEAIDTVAVILSCLKVKEANDEDFWSSDEFSDGEREFLILFRVLGYNYEHDYTGQSYCLKATPDEIINYHLEVVLPQVARGAWKVEFEVDGEWATNSCVYATHDEAFHAGRELMSRWMAPTDSRVVTAPDGAHPNYRFNFELNCNESLNTGGRKNG